MYFFKYIFIILFHSILFDLFQALKINIPELTKTLISAMGADIEKMNFLRDDGRYCANNDNDNDNDNPMSAYLKNESNSEVISLESIKEYVIKQNSQRPDF